MKREIKFRAWNIPNKTMYMDIQNGALCQNEKGQLILGTSFGTICKDAGSVVMQYTGLKDKNGKEIYEGDIILDLKAVEPEDKGFVVVCVNNWFKLKTNFTINGYLDHFELFDTSKHEIIGNIYENKELLK